MCAFAAAALIFATVVAGEWNSAGAADTMRDAATAGSNGVWGTGIFAGAGVFVDRTVVFLELGFGDFAAVFRVAPTGWVLPPLSTARGKRTFGESWELHWALSQCC